MSKKILYFVADANPTEAEFLDAARYGTRMFRNVQFDSDEAPLEECDGVAGCAPQRFVDKYTRATPLISGVPSPVAVPVSIPPPPPAVVVETPWQGNIPKL